ncbi:MAG: hypothetical protein WKH64_12655 [Chloroflexia bacterium]
MASLPKGRNTTTNRYGDRAINNDYIYPRSAIRSRAFGLDEVVNSNTGMLGTSQLVKGYIFPVDLNESQVADLQAALLSDAAPSGDIKATGADVRFDAEKDVRDSTSLSESDAGAQTTAPLRRLSATEITKRIRFSQGKQFQFNPPGLNIAIDFDTVMAPDASLGDGGADQGTSLGFASTGINMFFDRTQEVFAANQGTKGVDTIFRDIGVQKDFYDVFRVIMARDNEYWDKVNSSGGFIEGLGTGNVVGGSISDVMAKVFDLSASGYEANSSPVAVYFNANLVLLGLVTGISYVFSKFNASLVPYAGSIDVQLSILRSTSANAVNTLLAAGVGTTNIGLVPSSKVGVTVANASNISRPPLTVHRDGSLTTVGGIGLQV